MKPGSLNWTFMSKFSMSLSVTSVSDKSSSSTQEWDPLLRSLDEKKQIFRRSVVALASELKDVRSQLASHEESSAKERLTRQVAEKRVRCMEDEICHLQKSLEETNAQLQVSTSKAEKYLNELDDLKSQLSTTEATADANAVSALSAQLQCLVLLNEVNEKNSSLKEHEDSVNSLEAYLGHLQKDLQVREACQQQIKDDILRIQHEIVQASLKAKSSNECDLKKSLDEISPKSLEKIKKYLTAKDEEIARLRDEVGKMTASWKLKTKGLESQLEKHRRIDQELKKRILKLEFCLQEARSQMRKLQRIGEKREQALKELRKQLAIKQQRGAADKQNFWESSSFKIVVTMSMLILVLLCRR